LVEEDYRALPDRLRDAVAAASPLLSGDLSAWGPTRRQEVYAALGDPDDPRTQRSRAWLAALAGRKVLPIYLAALSAVVPAAEIPHMIAEAMRAWDWTQPFEQATVVYVAHVDASDPLVADAVATIYRDTLSLASDSAIAPTLRHGLEIVCDLVPLCLVLAEMIGQGIVKRDDAVLEEMSEFCYNAFGHAFDYAPLAAMMAADAANWALEEAQQRNPFANTSDVMDFNHELNGAICDGDVASVCAISGAMMGDNVVDLARLTALWRWWLEEAVPLAWTYGHRP